jgi:hypothetical protein
MLNCILAFHLYEITFYERGSNLNDDRKILFYDEVENESRKPQNWISNIEYKLLSLLPHPSFKFWHFVTYLLSVYL